MLLPDVFWHFVMLNAQISVIQPRKPTSLSAFAAAPPITVIAWGFVGPYVDYQLLVLTAGV